MNIEPLGRLARTHTAGELTSADVDKDVVLLGWVHRIRDLGSLVFIDLRDRHGLTQVVARDNEPLVNNLKRLRSEFVISVKGKVVARATDAVNPKMKTGEIEVEAVDVRLLNDAKVTPFPIADETTQASEDLRLKYRYLDLRRPRLQRNLTLRHKATMAIRKYFDEQGFLEIETPMLTKSTPEGARDYLVPSRVHHGHFYALPQSPQLFKQILMVSGFDRYFQIVRCFRDEDLRADRQPEFTQVDVGMSFPGVDTIGEMLEPLFVRLSALVGVNVPRPFPRMTYAEAMERYGSDKPDLRFDMPIADVTDEMATLGLESFPALIADGARARAIVLPAAGAISGTRLRTINDELWLGRIVPDARAA